MNELINVSFGNKKIPEGWIEEDGNFSFEKGALRCGRVTRFRFPLPGNGWKKLRVELDVEVLEGATFLCGNGSLALITDVARGMHRVTTLPVHEELKSHQQKVENIKDSNKIIFDFSLTESRILVDGIEMVFAQNEKPSPSFGLFELEFWEDCLVHGIRILADEELDHPVYVYPERKNGEFHLEVNVDFVDDLLVAPWTAEMFDAAFAEFASWGVKRCHWIYYGNNRDGWWDNVPGLKDHAIKTMENVGEIFPAAVKAAHAHGIEIYGMFKPFEMGFFYSYGEGMPEAKTQGKLERVGGSVYWMSNFAAQHRELAMARKPDVSGPAENETFTRIDLVKENAEPAAFTVNDVKIHVSDDNTTYRPYEGKITRIEEIEDYPIWEHTSSGGRPTGETRPSRVMRFKDLEIRNKYVLLEVPRGKASFTNTLINLIHVFGEKGEERKLTFGVMPRAVKFKVENAGFNIFTEGFEKNGVEFDVLYGSGTALVAGADVIREPYSLDSVNGIFAIGRGKDTSPIGLLSPSFSEVRKWWLTWLRACLDAGADGIELRFRHHSYHMTWGEYGFERPVRDEFLKRHGVDIWKTDDFDKAAWRRLRGEGYTEFYREAKKLADSYGKPMGIHISPTLEMEPEVGGVIDMHFDWRGWLKEGLADSVTMKEVWPGTKLAEEILSLTRPRGIPVIFCPFGLNLWNKPGGAQRCENRILFAKDHGYDGFQYYECAAVITGTDDGRIIMEQPEMRKIFQKLFCNGHRS